MSIRNQAPFVWTPQQTIDPFAFLGVMSGGKPRTEAQNRWFYLRRKFALANIPETAKLNITVDGRYQLFVNGTRVGRGPARCSPLYQRYDSYDVAPYLHTGPNVMAVLMRVFGTDMSWYETVKGMWQPTFGDGGLWVVSDIQPEGETGPLITDENWRVKEASAWQNDAPHANHGLGCIEVYDANIDPQGWTQPDFEDQDWDAVVRQETGGGGPEAFMGGIQFRPFPVLLPNAIGPLTETILEPEALKWIQAVTVQPDMALESALYKEPLSDLQDGQVENMPAILRDDDDWATIRTQAGEGVSFLVDFGRITTIHPAIEIEAQGGEEIDIAVNERLPDEWTPDGPAPMSRITRSPLLGLDAHLSRYTARPGVQRFERFEWQAAKWMQVTIRNAPKGMRVRFVGGLYTRYGAPERGSFSCSDDMLTQLWDVGRYTLQLCMHDGWEDCPSREQRQWLGDATVENLVGHAAFGPSIQSLNAEFLRKCAESQRPDGLTQMFAPGNHGDNGLLIPDWSLQWILNAKDHLIWTDDLDVIEEIFPAIQRALAWFERLIGTNGLIADMPYWHFMDWAGLGRAGEAATLNAQLSGAFDCAALMAERLEATRTAARYKVLATNLRTALNARHWDEERGVYVDMVDPVSGAQQRRVSQHANAAMILWGGAPKARWARMIAWITDAQRVTFTAAPPIANAGDTLDEDAGVVMANTFYSHFVYEALAKANAFDRALEMMRRRYGSMLERGATTLWESFNPTASLCHGFSASPTWQFSTKILGIQREEHGQIYLAPNLFDLDQASGTMALREGDIEAKLTRDETGFTVQYALPDRLEAQIISPPGFSLEGETTVSGKSMLKFIRT